VRMATVGIEPPRDTTTAPASSWAPHQTQLPRAGSVRFEHATHIDFDDLPPEVQAAAISGCPDDGRAFQMASEDAGAITLYFFPPGFDPSRGSESDVADRTDEAFEVEARSSLRLG